MASNAASSVQFRANGTETARDGHAKLNAGGERTLAWGVDAGELPNSYCVNDRTAGTSDDGAPRLGISKSRQLARGRARRCRRLRHGANLSTVAFSRIFDAQYNPSLERVAFVHQLINTFRIDTFDFG